MDLEPYQTSDTPFAAFLHMKGMTLLSVVPDKHDWKRKVYVFLDDPSREQLTQEYKDDVGGFHTYWISLKIVQRRLHEK